MLKASPVEMRKALEAATMMKNAMILFVPMPVLPGENIDDLHREMFARMERIVEMTEREEEAR